MPQSPWRPARETCARCRRAAGTLTIRSVGPYEGRLRDVLHVFKYEGRRSLACALTTLVRDQAADVLASSDAVVPVPLHGARRRHRGFNQARDLAAGLGLPVLDALRRTRATPAQASLTAGARRRNVRGAFALAPVPRWTRDGWRASRRARVSRMAMAVYGRVVVLVDDVVTTGATLEACAAVLRAAGAADVRAVTVARAVIGRPR
jgi:ComF family protein